LRILILTLALSGIMLQGMSELVVYSAFRVNQEYIAKNLCEQRQVKHNCCQGKCQLRKELKENEQRQSPTSSQVRMETVQLFCDAFESPTVGTEAVKVNYHLFSSPVSNRMTASIFHPPRGSQA
jgi:hypothetical protein